jgi:phosphohistidine phosphatase
MLLAIVRHAKAERDAPSGQDLDRALSARGLRQATYLAERFADNSTRPDAIVASRARRTRQTAAPIAAACGVDFDFDDRLLVDQPVSAALELISARAGSAFLVLVGHNHQVTDLCAALTRGLGRPSPEDSGRWDAMPPLATGQAMVLRVARPELIAGCEVVDVWRLDEE